MKKKKLVISIIVMLMLAAVSSAWIVQRHRAVMEARAVEAEQREKELEKKRAEEEAAAKKEAEDAAAVEVGGINHGIGQKLPGFHPGTAFRTGCCILAGDDGRIYSLLSGQGNRRHL